VQYRFEDESQPRPNAPNYRVRIKENGNFSVETLMQHLMSTNQKDALAEQGDIIQALNIIMGHFPKTDPHILSLSANKHFLIEDRAEQSRLAAGLTAIRGYIISVRPATSRLLLNIQVKNAAIYSEVPLVDLIKGFGPANGFNRFRLNASLPSFVSELHIDHLVGNHQPWEAVQQPHRRVSKQYTAWLILVME
jgi:eukaryotic translation initiation factor 2C